MDSNFHLGRLKPNGLMMFKMISIYIHRFSCLDVVGQNLELFMKLISTFFVFYRVEHARVGNDTWTHCRRNASIIQQNGQPQLNLTRRNGKS